MPTYPNYISGLTTDTLGGAEEIGINDAGTAKKADVDAVKTYVNTTPTITGGTIDNTTIGGTTAAAGSFTTLNASSDVAFNTDTLFVDQSTSRVGIGTDSPSSKLTIKGDGVGGGDLGIFSTTAGAGFSLRTDSSTKLQIRESTASSDFLTITSTGDVGIGKANPDYLLDVDGTFGFKPGTSVTPVDNGDVVFEFTNDTTFTIKAKGSDGTVRSGTVTLS